MNHRIARHEFACSAVSSALRVVRFVGTEAISQPYRFEIELVSDDPEIDFSDVIDQPATLTMYRGDAPSEVDGIVTSLQQLHQTGKQSEFRYGYRAVLEPRLSRLTFSMQSRVFQNRTVEEIVAQILDEAGVDVEFDLTDSSALREYTTQYKETDLAFVQRLLEFEGIRYSFRHEGGAETLVVSDDAKAAAPIEGDAEIPYSHADGLRPTDSLETIRDFVLEQRLVTGKTRVKDYNYRTPGADVFSENELEAKGSTGVHSDYGVHAKDTDAADRLSKIRAEEIESTRVTATGTGDCLRFRAGQTFSIRDHYRDGLNQSYLLTAVQHAGAQPDAAEAALAEEALSDYSNAFSCVPASAPYRPPRVTPEPKLPGVMTAKVESGGGDYAYIDDEGRYRVKMPFDLADAQKGGASKPIRLAQPYSGAGYGMHFPVHADAEMVFACVDGNVDRPLGLSTVPNPSQGSPVTSANKTKNSIITASDNRIEIEDEKGSERIKLSSPHQNSVIQIGSPNCPLDGIATTTNGIVGIHGASGVYLNAFGSLTDTNWSGTLAGGVVGGAAFIIGQAVARRAGNFKAFAGVQAAMAVAKGASFVAPILLGEALPGITMAAPGHVRMATNNSIQGVALAGVSFLTAATTEVVAGLGVSIASGTGINLFAANDALRAVAQRGNVTIQSILAGISAEALEDVSLLSTAGDVKIKAEAGLKDVFVNAGQHIVSESGKDIISKTGQDHTVFAGRNARTTAKDQISIVCGKSEIVLTSDGKITLKSGSSTIKISGSEIAINKGTNSELKISSNGIFGKGLNTEFEAMTSAKLKANGSVALESSALAKIVANLITAGS